MVIVVMLYTTCQVLVYFDIQETSMQIPLYEVHYFKDYLNINLLESRVCVDMVMDGETNILANT